MTVFFIGAGPGDPELLTLKARRLIQRCELVLYAGSLVPGEVLVHAPAQARKIDSAPLALPEIIAHCEAAQNKGQDVARLHSGDPSLYGAIGEQIRALKQRGIPYEIIPGVTAASASAAWLGCELTLSGVSQSVIHTRYAGKTPMPKQENLSAMASTGATLAIHLSVSHIHKIAAELIPFYGADCPAAVCYRVGWPEQDYVTGALDNITALCRAKRFTRSALILVGRVLAPQDFAASYLYSPDKAHVYRPKFPPPAPRRVKRHAAR